MIPSTPRVPEVVSTWFAWYWHWYGIRIFRSSTRARFSCCDALLAALSAARSSLILSSYCRSDSPSSAAFATLLIVVHASRSNLSSSSCRSSRSRSSASDIQYHHTNRLEPVLSKFPQFPSWALVSLVSPQPPFRFHSPSRAVITLSDPPLGDNDYQHQPPEYHKHHVSSLLSPPRDPRLPPCRASGTTVFWRGVVQRGRQDGHQGARSMRHKGRSW